MELLSFIQWLGSIYHVPGPGAAAGNKAAKPCPRALVVSHVGAKQGACPPTTQSQLRCQGREKQQPQMSRGVGAATEPQGTAGSRGLWRTNVGEEARPCWALTWLKVSSWPCVSCGHSGSEQRLPEEQSGGSVTDSPPGQQTFLPRVWRSRTDSCMITFGLLDLSRGHPV